MDVMNLPSKGFGCISDIDEVGNFALLRPRGEDFVLAFPMVRAILFWGLSSKGRWVGFSFPPTVRLGC